MQANKEYQAPTYQNRHTYNPLPPKSILHNQIVRNS